MADSHETQEERDLYLKFVMRQYRLRPVSDMIKQEQNNIQIHRRKLDEHGTNESLEWKWRRQLIANAQARLDRWTEIESWTK